MTHAGRALAGLFGFGFVLGFALTPLGVETRRHDLRHPAIAVYFITVGLLLPLAGLASLLLGRRKLAGVLAMVDAASLLLTAPADQQKLFFKTAPPPAVTAGEYALILVAIGYLLYGPRVSAEGDARAQDTEPTREGGAAPQSTGIDERSVT